MANQPAMEIETATIDIGDVSLDGELKLPERATGIVVFAHGSGSSRFSPRNQFVADTLNEGGLGTLLFDLLTADEHQLDERTREFRFDIDLLARRLVGAIDWIGRQPQLSELRIGLFGASTGAAAALRGAAERPDSISAVVSRGGRPDLAGEALSQVRAPTLLIVGGYDTLVIALNEQAARSLTCPKRIEVVPAASHLFEEPGKLDEVAHLARDWFIDKLESVAYRGD